MSRPLPSKSVSIHYSPIILPFNATWPNIFTGSQLLHLEHIRPDDGDSTFLQERREASIRVCITSDNHGGEKLKSHSLDIPIPYNSFNFTSIPRTPVFYWLGLAFLYTNTNSRTLHRNWRLVSTALMRLLAHHSGSQWSMASNVFARSSAGAMGSNPTRGMDVCVCVYSVLVLFCV
jgi:hypothetical protein